MPKSEPELTVLIVSPYEEDLAGLRRALRAFGLNDWRVVWAQNCLEACLVLGQDRVDAVIAEADELDWRELLDEIGSAHGFQPVVVASRLADERLWAEALNLGAYDLIAKPFDGEELAQVIPMAVRQASHSRQNWESRQRETQAV